MIFKSFIIEENLGSLKKINLFYGENLGLKNDFKKKISEFYSSYETIKLYQEDILKNSNFFFNEINNISLFEKKKVFILDQVNDKLLPIINQIEVSIGEHKICLFSEALEKKSKIRNFFEKSKEFAVIPCYQDNEISLKKIINNQLKGFAGLTPSNLNLIIEKTGFDRAKLNNEIDKIKIFFQKSIIETEKLELLLNIEVNDNFRLLKDQALVGNKAKTNKLLSDTIIEDEKSIYYLNLINQRLINLKDLHKLSGVNIEDKINSLKPPIFWKDKSNFLKQSEMWNINKIKKLQEKTYNLELMIKSNSIVNKNTLIKELIVDICRMANT